MPYLNPAGVSGLPHDVFAVSATIYSYTRRSFDGFFLPNGPDPGFGRLEVDHESFETTSVLEIPSSVVYVKQLSKADATVRHTLSASLVIPELRRVELLATFRGRFPEQNGRFRQSRSLAINETHYYVGPTYSVAVGDSLRFGASLFTVYYQSFFSWQSSSDDSLFGGAISGSFSGQNAQANSAWAVVPVVGIQAQIVPRVWLGAGVAPTLPISRGDFTFSSQSGFNGGSDSSTAEGTYHIKPPLRFNAGIAYDDRESFSLAADVHYSPGTRDVTSGEGVQFNTVVREGEVPRSFAQRITLGSDSDAVVNLSAGGEVALSSLFAIRAGAFTDFSHAPDITSDVAHLHRMKLDRAGGTAGLGVRLGPFDTTFGAVYARGWGRFGAFDPVGDPSSLSTAPIETTENTILFLFSGAVTTEEAKKTIRDTVPVDLSVPVVGDPLDVIDGEGQSTPPATAPSAPAPRTPPAPEPRAPDPVPAPPPATPPPDPAPPPAPAPPPTPPQDIPPAPGQPFEGEPPAEGQPPTPGPEAPPENEGAP